MTNSALRYRPLAWVAVLLVPLSVNCASRSEGQAGEAVPGGDGIAAAETLRGVTIDVRRDPG